MASEVEVEDFLEHFGVKGMKWGKRNQKRLARANRVGKGTASKADKAIFGLTDTSSSSIRRNKGLQGAGKMRAKELGRRKARINAGKAGVRDYIALKGGDKLHITGKDSSGKKAKVMSPRTKKKVLAGASFAANLTANVATANARSKRGPFENLLRDVVGKESQVMDNRRNQMANDAATVFARKRK